MQTSFFAGYFVGAFVMLMCALFLIGPGQFKQGQIAAIQGDIKYVLKDNPDGTRVWVEK